ncbi:PorT family protein [Terrimonas sp. NA20]|uniref:PorT family protein n=1 Tax=Terrimonas ginsenosidimutans TaxID=2908004 RepID=A0ABS9KVQ2_9BACT|nr:porin family protein [Terrimonas ginsenosidimutans]MCG2616417.1 PorT family protein [Terrimonas ginsenosidimutans]
MKTAKILAIAALTLSGFAVSAQQKTSFGIRGGVNFQNINGDDASGGSLDNKLKVGFLAGVNAEIPVGIDFYVQPGVLYAVKGAKNDIGDTKVNLGYVEVPVNFLYKPELGTGHLLLGVGPYIAFGVNGKIKSGGSEEDIKFKNTVTVAEAAADPYLKRIDAGGNLLFGYEMANHLSIQLNAQLGMVKINPKVEGISNDQSSWKNTGFGVSLGYRF